MLSSLKIENVAVIEQAEIFFDRGLNILTGETGAGKSIIIDSINAILGERTSRDIVRSGCEKAKVTAIFDDIPEELTVILESFDIDTADESLLITRIISSDGRGSCKVNGCPVTASMLKEIGRHLITICGQHDSQFLLSKEHHLHFVDLIADSDELLADYKETYSELRTANKKLKSLLKNEDDKERRLEYLKYQIQELNDAELVIGEKESLLQEKKKIAAREKIINALSGASVLLNGDENSRGLTYSMHELMQCLSEISEYDSKFSDIAASLSDTVYLLEDCSAEVSSSLDYDDVEYTDIDSIEQRLDLLYRLSKKYGSTEEEMLKYLDKITEEYESIIMSDELCDKLIDEINILEDELFKRGCYLSDCRKKAAFEFEEKVKNELLYLDMPDAVFAVDFKDGNATETGLDEVEFLFSANSGQEPRSLHKIASGGELSRVMLAIRCVLSNNDSLETMIFDEIDTGVSGRAAHKIAYKMHELSFEKQVICVTHLAQIAAYADNHLYIEKSVRDGSTFTVVTSLSQEKRVKEIARIIGGDVITDTTLDSAKELIDFAQNEI